MPWGRLAGHHHHKSNNKHTSAGSNNNNNGGVLRRIRDQLKKGRLEMERYIQKQYKNTSQSDVLGSVHLYYDPFVNKVLKTE